MGRGRVVCGKKTPAGLETRRAPAAAIATAPAAAAPQGYGGGRFGNRYTHRGGGEGRKPSFGPSLRLVVKRRGRDYSRGNVYKIVVYKTKKG
jgi:hypothetical protein